jgi:hypothetical protein
MGLATVLPALVHGGSLGPYQLLASDGVLSHHFAPVLGQFQSNQDPLLLAIPFKALSWTQVHGGHLPLWNPYNVLGMPLAFNWESASFSLQSLIGYLAPLRFVFTISVVTSLVLAGTGAYVFARLLRVGVLGAAMAGTVYALSGPFTALLDWQDTAVMCFAGWLFAVALLILKGRHRVRYIVIFAVILAFAGYAGQPETFFFLTLSLTIFLGTAIAIMAYRKKAVRPFVRPIGDVLLASVAGVALFAPLALPALQVSAGSVRSKWEPVDDVSTARYYFTLLRPPSTLRPSMTLGQPFSLHDLTHLIFQTFDGLPVTGGYFFADRFLYFESAAYLGVVAIVLAGLAIVFRRRNPIVIALTVMVLCMFSLVFVPPVVSAADHLPLVGTFLWNRALLPMAFGVAVLSGIGIDVLVKQHDLRNVRRAFAAGFALMALVLGSIWFFGRGHLPAAEAEVRAHSFIWPVASTIAGLLLAGVLVGLYSKRFEGARVSRAKVVTAIAGLLLVVESSFLVSAAAPTWTSASQFLPHTPAEAALARTVGSNTVGFGEPDCYSPTLGITANLNAAYGVHEFTSYDPMTPLRYFTSWQRASGRNPGFFLVLNVFCPAVTSAAAARQFGIGYVLEQAGFPGPVGGVFVSNLGSERLYRIPGASTATLVAAGTSGGPPTSATAGTPISVGHTDPANWTIHVDSSSPKFLQLRISDVPGWHATIDGKPLATSPLSSIMLQVRVPAGHHTIELDYWPTDFTLGIGLAVISALALCGASGVAYLRVRRRGGVSRSAPSEGVRTEH